MSDLRRLDIYKTKAMAPRAPAPKTANTAIIEPGVLLVAAPVNCTAPVDDGVAEYWTPAYVLVVTPQVLQNGLFAAGVVYTTDGVTVGVYWHVVHAGFSLMEGYDVYTATWLNTGVVAHGQTAVRVVPAQVAHG
jgi:hypothetical protein